MEITASAVQVVAANSNILFTDTAVGGNCSIIHRDGSGLVTLRGLSASQNRARFRVTYGGNIAVPSTGTAGPISLTIAIDGEPITSTEMIVTPAAVSQYFNVSGSIFIDVPKCCCYTIAVENTSTQAIAVQNSNLIVERVA